MTPMQKVEVLRAACCVAGIDGNVESTEKRVLDALAREVGVGRASLAAMIERASTDSEFHEEQFRVLKEDPQASMATILEVALADGTISDAECGVLRELAQQLNVPGPIFDELIDQVSKLN